MKNRKEGGEGSVWSMTQDLSPPSQAGGVSPVRHGEALGYWARNVLLAASAASTWSTTLEHDVIDSINSEGTNRYFKQENIEDMGYKQSSVGL